MIARLPAGRYFPRVILVDQIDADIRNGLSQWEAIDESTTRRIW